MFRVVADQLKLRGGLVRCGQCRIVFDAIGSLTYLDDSALAQSRSAASSSRPPRSSESAHEDSPVTRQSLGPSTTLRISPVAPATLAGNVAPRIELPQAPREEPALVRRRAKEAARETAMSGKPAADSPSKDAEVSTLVSPIAAAESLSAVGASEGVEEVEVLAVPDGNAAEEAPTTEPVASFARPKRRVARSFSIIFGGGSVLLAALAAVQLAVIFRADLMVHWPQSRPWLAELCAAFRCTLGWPTRADQLAVIGTELQAIAGTDALELTAVIRNRAGFRQALPAVEVTLTDSSNRALARKVFSPADYLASAGEPSSRLEDGLAPGSDFTIRIFFEARGLSPAGFLVYPFYL